MTSENIPIGYIQDFLLNHRDIDKLIENLSHLTLDVNFTLYYTFVLLKNIDPNELLKLLLYLDKIKSIVDILPGLCCDHNMTNIFDDFIKLKNEIIEIDSSYIFNTHHNSKLYVMYMLNKYNQGEINIIGEWCITNLLPSVFSTDEGCTIDISLIEYIINNYGSAINIAYEKNLLFYTKNIDISNFEKNYEKLRDLGIIFTVDFSYMIKGMTEELATVVITLHSENKIEFTNEDHRWKIVGCRNRDICYGIFILIDYILSYKKCITIEVGLWSDGTSYIYKSTELFEMFIKFISEERIFLPVKSPGFFNFLSKIEKNRKYFEILFKYYTEYPNSIIKSYVDFKTYNYPIRSYNTCIKIKDILNNKEIYDFYLEKYNLGYDFMIPNLSNIYRILYYYPEIINDIYHTFNMQIDWQYFFNTITPLDLSVSILEKSIYTFADYIENKPIITSNGLFVMIKICPDIVTFN